MNAKSKKSAANGPFTTPPNSPPAKENLGATPEASNIVPEADISPPAKLANPLNPQLDQEPSQGLQKRIPEDPEQAAFFYLDDIVPTPLVPQYTPFVKKAGVYPEPYRTELPLTVTNVFDLKVLAREKFTLTSTGNRARFNTLDMALRTNGLASMVDRETRSARIEWEGLVL